MFYKVRKYTRNTMQNKENSYQIVPGMYIGQFEIIKPIGAGGMGAVYLAKQNSPARYVALKLMTKVQGTSRLRLQRFKREIESSAKLNNPHIVKIYVAEIETTIPYIAMEYISGLTLKEYLKRKKCSLDEKLKLFLDIILAIDYAHKEGILHRDIKPANIMIRQNHKPVVMDFGLAKSSKVYDKKLTATGEIVGTPRYMPPEQVRGSRNIDEKADIYALGAVLYEMITEEKLFAELEGVSLLYSVISDIPKPPNLINKDIPKPLEAIILKSLEKIPRRRYQTAQAFAQDVQNFLLNKQTQAFKEQRYRKVRNTLQKNRNIFLCGAMAFVIVFIFLCIQLISSMKTTKKKKNVTVSFYEREKRITSNKASVDDYIAYIRLAQKIRSFHKAEKVLVKAFQLCRKLQKKTRSTKMRKKLKDSIQILRENQVDILYNLGKYQECESILHTLPKKRRCFFAVKSLYILRTM